MLHTRPGCILEDLAAVCLPCLHLADCWSDHSGISHYSTKATRIFGNNSVSVLTTLFLLSYAKLLRTILIILEFTVLDYPNGPRTVWSFDGNLSYFGLKHSFLFVMAITILFALWLPYTFTLLFIQGLRRCSHYSCLRWVNKLYPVFDSYLGPIKAKHYYWIGLGLLARLVLLVTSAATLTTEPLVAALMIGAITSLFSLFVFSVYKQWQLSLLEACFLVNLAMFSSGALFIHAKGGSKDSLACTSLGTAFILFLVIIAFHVWKKLTLLKTRCERTSNSYENIDSSPQNSLSQQLTTYQEVSIDNKLRESLFESIN